MEMQTEVTSGEKELMRWLRTTVDGLCDRPGAIAISAQRGDENKLTFIVQTPDEVGKLLGKNGRTARSIRTMLSSIGAKHGVRAQLNIVMPDGIVEETCQLQEV